MTPEEAIFMQRVANGHANRNDSPIVEACESESAREIDPIVNNDNNLNLVELDLRVDAVESIVNNTVGKLNSLETKLDGFQATNNSPDLAQVKADVAELKTIRDTIRLSPADVLTGVIKPIKLDSADSLLDTNFIEIAITTGNANAPYNENEVGTYIVRSMKDIGDKPKNLIDLDGLEAASTVLNKLSGEINQINDFIRITSNNGITDIDLSNQTIPSVEFAPLETGSLVTIEPQSVEFASFVSASGTITANRDFYICTLDLGESYAYGVTLPTFTANRYSLVQNSTFQWVLQKFTVNVGWANETSGTVFTGNSIGANSCMVIFKNNFLVKLEFLTDKYIFNDYAPVSPISSGNLILMNDPATSNKYIVNPNSVIGSISATNLQTVVIQKPQPNNLYFKLNAKNKIIKCLATTGSVLVDSGLIYFRSNNQLYNQPAGNNPFNKLVEDQWLYNTESKQLQRNHDGVSEQVPAGYYNYNDCLVKIDSLGKIVYDGQSAESINYKLPSALNARITVPTLNLTSTLTQALATPLSYLSITSSDMYIDSQLNLRGSSNTNILNYNGLYWVNGGVGLTRANKLYRINSLGKCELYTGLAYLEIEADNIPNGIRVWYSVTAGVISQLRTDDYLLTSNNQVVRISIIAPTVGSNSYGSNLINFTTSVNGIAAFSRTRNQLVNVSGAAGILSDQQLSRMRDPTEVNVNARKYITLGYMSGGDKTTVDECILAGGVEAISDVDNGHFTNKLYKVLNNPGFELVIVDIDGNKAFASYSNSLLKNSAVYKLNSVYYNVDTTQKNKLTKVTSGWIFNDADEQKDLRMINKDGTLSSDFNSTSSCRHFAWNNNGVKTIFYAKQNPALDIVKCNSAGYPNYTTSTNGNRTTMVFLLQVPTNSTTNDEEDVTDTSNFTMYRLKINDSTITPLVAPSASGKQWKFNNTRFEANEFPKISGASTDVYWNITPSGNKPYINRIVNVLNKEYSTDNTGLLNSSEFINEGQYFTDPTCALLIGVGSSTRTKINAGVNNKVYIDYYGNLSKSSPPSGDKLSVLTNNYFVIFADNDNRARYFSNGRQITPELGTLVAVSSNAASQTTDHKYNGLKMWGKDDLGDAPRWLNMQADVYRQSNDAPVSTLAKMYDFVTASSAGAIATNNVTDYNFTKAGTNTIKLVTGISYPSVVDLTGSVIGGSAGTDIAVSATDNGKYFYNTNTKILKIVVNGALVAVGTATVFTLSGAVQTTGTGGVATGIIGAVGQAVKLVDGTVKLITVVGTGGLFSDGTPGTGATIAYDAANVFDTTNKKFYLANTGALATTAINYLRDGSNGSWTSITTSKFIKVSANGSAEYAALNKNDGLAETSTGTGIFVMTVPVAANTAIGNNASTTLFKLANNATCLLEIAMGTYTDNKVIQKDGSVYWFGSSNETGKSNKVAGNSGSIQLLVIDGMVQNERAPRGTQIQVAGTSTVKPYTRLGYSQAEATAKGLDIANTAIKDSWVTVA